MANLIKFASPGGNIVPWGNIKPLMVDENFKVFCNLAVAELDDNIAYARFVFFCCSGGAATVVAALRDVVGGLCKS